MKKLTILTFLLIVVTGCSGGSSTSQAETLTAIVATKGNQPIIENEDLTAGLKGVDANNNGIRDDIDQLIAQKYSTTPEIKKAVEQHAKALQKFMEVTDKNQARLTGQDLMRSMDCTFKIFPRSTPQEKELYYRLSKEIEALTANTKERFAKYWDANDLVKGMGFAQAKEPVCD